MYVSWVYSIYDYRTARGCLGLSETGIEGSFLRIDDSILSKHMVARLWVVFGKTIGRFEENKICGCIELRRRPNNTVVEKSESVIDRVYPWSKGLSTMLKTAKKQQKSGPAAVRSGKFAVWVTSGRQMVVAVISRSVEAGKIDWKYTGKSNKNACIYNG